MTPPRRAAKARSGGRPTLKDVAQASGYSVATVAFILRGHPKAFPDETRERVLAAAERIDYRPNASARATRSGRMGAFALVQIDDPQQGHLAWPTLDGVLRAVESAGDHLLFTRLPREVFEDGQQLPKILHELVVDGLVLSYHTAAPPRLADMVRELRIPAVWLNTRGARDCVHLDDHAGAVIAVEKLSALGHRRISYINTWHPAPETPRHYSMDDRLAGYRAAMAAAGQEPHALLGGTDSRKLALALLAAERRPSAVVVYDIAMVADLLLAAAHLGLSVPQDLSIVTFCDQPAHVGQLDVTTVVGGHGRMGAESIAMLRRVLADSKARQPPIAILPDWHPGQSSARAGGH